MFHLNKEAAQRMKPMQLRSTSALLLITLGSCLLISSCFNFGVECRGDKGDDIIMTKGKLIVRGGKGKGNMFDLLFYYLAIMSHLSATNPTFLAKLPTLNLHAVRPPPIDPIINTQTSNNPLTFQTMMNPFQNLLNTQPGNLILDTGKSHSDHQEEHHPQMMPMMPFNPYHFYPMQQHPQPMMVHPIYIEDHSAMHHHQPMQQHHYEPPQHHEVMMHQHQGEPQQQHHQVEMEQHQHQEEQPEQHQEMQHEMHQMPMMMHHMEQPEQHHEEMQHHQPMGHYEHEPVQHQEEEHHEGGYETNPAVQFMMQNQAMQNQAMQQAASGGSPGQTVQQLASLQAYQNPLYLHQMQQAVNLNNQQQQLTNQNTANNQIQQQQQQVTSSSSNAQSVTQKDAASPPPPTKKFSLLSSSANNSLISIIKPLFKRDPNKQKKP